MCLNDSGIHVSGESEIVSIDDQMLQLENMQLDAQELLRICPEVSQGLV